MEKNIKIQDFTRVDKLLKELFSKGIVKHRKVGPFMYKTQFVIGELLTVLLFTREKERE